MKTRRIDKVTVLVISLAIFICLLLGYRQYTTSLGPIVSGNFDWSPDGKRVVFQEKDTHKLVFVNEQREFLSKLEISSLSSDTLNLNWFSEDEIAYLIKFNEVGIFNLQTQKEEILNTPTNLKIREMCVAQKGQIVFIRHGQQLTKQSLGFYNLNTEEWTPIGLNGYLQSMSCDKESGNILIEMSKDLFTVSIDTDRIIVDQVGEQLEGIRFIDAFNAQKNTYFAIIDVSLKAQARIVYTDINSGAASIVRDKQGINVYVSRAFKYSSENKKMLVERSGNIIEITQVNLP